MYYLDCTQCDYKVINYSNKFCRRRFLPLPRQNLQINTPANLSRDIKDFKNSSTNSGLNKLNEFITETQLKSKYCDDFIEWIPRKNLENVKYLTRGGNSEVYSGIWNLSLDMHLTTNVILKAIKDSDNILNEVRILIKASHNNIQMILSFLKIVSIVSLKHTINAVVNMLYHFME